MLLWDVHKESSISPKNTKGIIYELHRRSINIQMDFAYSSLSNNEREQFDQVIKRIHSKIENYLTSNLNRRQFCDLILGDLDPSSSNDMVLQHIEKILPQVTTIYNQINKKPIYVKINSELYYSLSESNYNDLAEAIKDVANKKYY